MDFNEKDIKKIEELKTEMNHFLIEEGFPEKIMSCPKGFMLWFLIKFSKIENRLEELEKNVKS
jgi:hypothetical protein